MLRGGGAKKISRMRRLVYIFCFTYARTNFELRSCYSYRRVRACVCVRVEKHAAPLGAHLPVPHFLKAINHARDPLASKPTNLPT